MSSRPGLWGQLHQSQGVLEPSIRGGYDSDCRWPVPATVSRQSLLPVTPGIIWSPLHRPPANKDDAARGRWRIARGVPKVKKELHALPGLKLTEKKFFSPCQRDALLVR